MSRRKTWTIITFHLVLFATLISACSQPDPSPTAVLPTAVATATEEVEVDEEPVTIEVTRIVVETEVIEVSPAVELVEEQLKELNICLGSEPDSLYPYSHARLEPAAVDVLTGLYESMTTNLSYDYQARGIEKLPRLADGDAVIEPVNVSEGDRVYNANDDIVTLSEGVKVRNFDGDIVIFDGQPITMPQLTLNFVLKPLVWSDGIPVTADDSVYSFELAADVQTPVLKQIVERTAAYEASGDLTLRWRAIPGYIDTNYHDKVWTPYPRHYWGEFTAAELLNEEVATRNPLSHGPYVLQEWVAGDQITLVKNKNYYLAGEGLPLIDIVHFRIRPANSLLTQLLSGECDLVTHQNLSFSEAPLLIEAEENNQLVAYFQSGTVFEHIDFGINPVEEYANTQPNWFVDPRVRQAITMCLDRQAIIDELLFGRTELLHAYVPSIHPLYPEDLVEWPYDVAAANALLDEAGFPFPEEGDVRVDALSRTQFELTLLGATGNDLGQQVASRFQEDLAQCGIAIELKLLHADQYFADGPEGPLFGRQFDLAAFPWLISTEPNCALFLSTATPGPDNNWNFRYNNETGFRNDEFDAACEAARSALPGTPEYEQSHREALRIWSEQVPIIPLFMRLKVAATQPGVQNLLVDPTEPSDIWNIYELDIE